MPNLVLARSYVTGGSTITESFDKADGTDLGPDLTWNELQGDFFISGNAAVPQGSSAGHFFARAEHDLSSSNMYATATVNWRDGSINLYSSVGLTARGNASNLACYCARIDGYNGNIQLWRIDSGGGFTNLANVNISPTYGAGYHTSATLRLEVSGTSLVATLTKAGNPTYTATATDAVIATGTRAGLQCSQGGSVTTGATWHNFEAGVL